NNCTVVVRYKSTRSQYCFLPLAASRTARAVFSPSMPLVIAYHLIWTIYGYWLPNDLRGSTSKVIRNDLLKELGELHFGRKKLQPCSKDLRAFDQRAANLLRFPVI